MEPSALTNEADCEETGSGQPGLPDAGVGQPTVAVCSPDALALARQTWGRAKAHATREVRAPKAPASFSRKTGIKGRHRVRTVDPLDWKPPVPETLPEVLVPVLPTEAAPRHVFGRCAAWAVRRLAWDRRVGIGIGMLAAALLLIWHDGAATLIRGGAKADEDMLSPTRQILTASEWFQHAQDRVDEGDFNLALGTIRYALDTNPNNAKLLKFEGDMHQSLFQFQEAQAAYEQALRLDAGNQEARQNLALCRRLERYRFDPVAHPSSLYGLHRVMLEQKRISEALAISKRLSADRALRQTTWQAALDQTGLAGKITVEADDSLTLDLAGRLRPDLTLIRGFPVNRLSLADTGLEDIQALREMPLRFLDLTRTLVHDLSPLRGMPLQSLNLRGTGVVELSDLSRCPLRELDVSSTRIGDFSALAHMPLHSLRASDTPVADLQPLTNLPLTELFLARTRVAHLSPLANLGLRVLDLKGTGVTDLSALQSCALQELSLAGTPVHDLSPLRGMPLRRLSLAGCVKTLDLRPLAACQELEHLLVPERTLNREALAGLPRLRFVQQEENQPATLE